MTDLNDDETFEVRFEERDDYLYAFVSGEEDSAPAGLIYWNRVLNECKRLGFKKLLMEEDFPNQVSTIDMFNVVDAISRVAPHGLKIAFVDRRSDHDDLNLFGETVAVNRGVHCHVFKELADAETWLKS